MTTRLARNRWLLIAALTLMAGVLLAALLWPRALAVEVAPVTRGPIADVVADQGIARVRQAYVVSAPIGGRLERIPLEVGDRVTANTTPVARIRPAASELLDPRARAQAEAARDAARSAVTAATAQRDRLTAESTQTQHDLTRLKAMADAGFLSPQALETAQTAADEAAHAAHGADADLLAARANLASAEALLAAPSRGGSEAVTFTSPASGIVTQVVQQSARAITPGTPLVEISDTTGLEAQIEFLSQDAVKIRPGMRAEIYDWGGPATIPAQVRRVEPKGFTKVSALGVEEQRTLVMLQFTSSPTTWRGLAPGYRVWGRVFLREIPSAVLVPLGALVRADSGWAVFRIEHGRARLRTIRIGTMADRDAEVLMGLSPGDSVAVYPSDLVHDGITVRPTGAR